MLRPPVVCQPGVRAGSMQRGAAGGAARAAAEPERHRAATHVRHAQGAHCQGKCNKHNYNTLLLID